MDVDTNTVAVPVPPDERLTVAGLMVTVGPGGETDSAMATVLLNPFKLVRVMVERAEEPATMLRLNGFAAIVKSGGGGVITMKVAVTLCTSAPLVPITVSPHVPLVWNVVPKVRVELADPSGGTVTMLGLILQVGQKSARHAGGSVKVTVPLKPFTLVIVIVENAEDPGATVWDAGLALITKSVPVLVENRALCIVSGTGLGVPFAIVTQTPPGTLVFEQPVWKPRLVPKVVPVML